MTDSSAPNSQTQSASSGNLSATAIAPKSPFTSRTIIGVLIAILPIVARWGGVQLDDAETQATADDLVTIAGAVFAIYGRFKASRPVAIRTSPGAAVLLALGAFAVLVLLPGCVPGGLPKGSYLEGRTGYSKADGASGKAVLHIPLAQRFRTTPPPLRPLAMNAGGIVK